MLRLAAVILLLGLISVAKAPIARAGDLSWGSSTLIDGHEGNPLYAVACSSSTQCTTVDGAGRELTFSPSQSTAAQPAVIDAGNSPNAVSCPSTTLCVEVDGDGTDVAFNPQTGSVARATDIDGFETLWDLACLSATECVAVDDEGYELTFNPETAAISARTDVTPGSELYSVSCPSSSVCVAVGESGEEAAFNPGSGAVEHSGDLDGSYGLLSVACASTTVCIAGDDGGDEVSFNPSPSSGAFAVTSDVQIDPGTDSYGDAFDLQAAACISTSDCVLTDDYGEGFWINPSSSSPAASDRFLDTNDIGVTGVACLSAQCVAVSGAGAGYVFNTSWTVSDSVELDPGGDLEAVSCPTSTSCTSVDYFGYEISYNPAVPAQASSYQITSELSDVSCPTTSECVAVDYLGSAIEFSPSNPGGASVRSVDASSLYALSCPSSTLCVASDSDGRIAAFDPLTTGTPFLSTVDAAPISAITCPSTSQCTGVDTNGSEVTFNPESTAVPTPVPLDTGAYGNGVSCASVQLCVMVDNNGEAVAFDPQTGSVVASATIDNQFAVMAVSCPSASLCEAVDYAGDIFQGYPSNPSSWTSEHLAGASEFGAITCAPTSVCVAVDDVGNSYLGQGGTWFPVPGSQSAPAIRGNPVVGSTLTESHGGWSYSPTSYSYQWEDCNTSGQSCSAISGATGQSYTLTNSDAGHTIVVQETAVNSTGAGQPAYSAPSAVIAAAPNTVSGAVSAQGTVASIVGVSVKGLKIVASVSCGGSGTCGGAVTLTSASGHTTLGSAGFAVPGGRTETIAIPLSAAGLALIDRAHGYRLRVDVGLEGSSGSSEAAVIGYHRFAGNAISYQLGVGPTFSEIVSLAARSLPKHASVEVTCSGQGCPFGAKHIRPKKSSVSLSALFADAKLVKGRVVVRLAASGFIGNVFVVDIPGGGKAASFRSLCAVPGRGTEKCS